MANTHRAHHELLVNCQLGPVHLDVQLDLTAPWTIIFGPSGSGKSSILRAMAGLPLPDKKARTHFERHNPDGSWISLSDRPTYNRDLAFAPQSPSLFPHLTIQENVSFPFESCAEPPLESLLIDEALTLFNLHPLADRYPHQLSGGERQRANLARAFATPCARLILLDEPFSGVDRKLRDNLIPRMKSWLADRNLPTISVTHDVDEALLLDAEVIRLEAGHVLAQGPASSVLADERARLLSALA